LIDEAKLQKIIEAGTYAATGMGKQSPIIIAVTNRELRDKISAMNARIMGKPEVFDPFYGAPELLIVLADRSVPTYVYDGSLVMGNMMNAAEDLGISSCWIHRAKEEFETEEGRELLDKLGIEGDYEGIGHLALGYAAAPPKEAAPRKANYVYYIR
jgi:nitroreductase